MNFIIKINDFFLENIHFLETKKNIIMDGNFTKISYSDDCISLNGIYIYFPIEKCEGVKTEKMMNKNMIYFDPNLPSNKQLIKKITKIEKNILDYFLFINMNNNENHNYENIFSGLRNYDSSILCRRRFETAPPIDAFSELLSHEKSNNTPFEIFNGLNKMNHLAKNNEIDIAYEKEINKEINKIIIRKKITEMKQVVNKLETQLQNGYIKLFKKNYLTTNETHHFILKISGVWENNFQIGITYKFMEILGEPKTF